jgi:hypothetical protein
MSEIPVPRASSSTGLDADSADAGHGVRPKPVTLLIVGAGQRGQVRSVILLVTLALNRQIYAEYCLQHPTEAKVVAVAEPRPHRRRVTSRAHK